MLSSGCSHYYYVPSDNNLMALAEKHDAKVAAGGNFSGEFRTYAAQVGYSPIKHLGLKGQFFHIKDRHGVPEENGGVVYSNTYRGNGYGIEGSVGGYLVGRDWDSEASERSQLIMPLRSSFDLYLGYGRGQIRNQYATYTLVGESAITGTTKLKLNKYFMQLGAHLSLYSLSLHLGFRSSILDYTEGTIYGNIGENNEEDIYRLRSFDPIFTYETSFRFQVGIRHARLFISGTAARYDEELRDLFKSSAFQFGGVFELDELFRKEESIPQSSEF